MERRGSPLCQGRVGCADRAWAQKHFRAFETRRVTPPYALSWFCRAFLSGGGRTAFGRDSQRFSEGTSGQILEGHSGDTGDMAAAKRWLSTFSVASPGLASCHAGDITLFGPCAAKSVAQATDFRRPRGGACRRCGRMVGRASGPLPHKKYRPHPEGGGGINHKRKPPPPEAEEVSGGKRTGQQFAGGVAKGIEPEGAEAVPQLSSQAAYAVVARGYTTAGSGDHLGGIAHGDTPGPLRAEAVIRVKEAGRMEAENGAPI